MTMECLISFFSFRCVPYTQIDSSIYCQSWWWNEFCHICLNLNNARGRVFPISTGFTHISAVSISGVSQLRDEGATSSCVSYHMLTFQSQSIYCQIWKIPFHALFLIARLADGDSMMCCIVTMGRQIAKMFSTFSLWGSLFLMACSCIWVTLQTVKISSISKTGC